MTQRNSYLPLHVPTKPQFTLLCKASCISPYVAFRDGSGCHLLPSASAFRGHYCLNLTFDWISAGSSGLHTLFLPHSQFPFPFMLHLPMHYIVLALASQLGILRHLWCGFSNKPLPSKLPVAENSTHLSDPEKVPSNYFICLCGRTGNHRGRKPAPPKTSLLETQQVSFPRIWDAVLYQQQV